MAGDRSMVAGAKRTPRDGPLSPRHLTRLFRDELKTTPARYVELIRFDTAKGPAGCRALGD